MRQVMRLDTILDHQRPHRFHVKLARTTALADKELAFIIIEGDCKLILSRKCSFLEHRGTTLEQFVHQTTVRRLVKRSPHACGAFVWLQPKNWLVS